MRAARQWLMLVFAGALQLATAEGNKDFLQQALEHHGWHSTGSTEAVSQCQTTQPAHVKIVLQPTGFHGQIQYGISHSELVHFDGCKLTVLQPLPAGIFADPYELENLVTAGERQHNDSLRLSMFRLFGTIDVEKIECDCNATVLSASAHLHSPKEAAKSCSGAQHSYLSVPMHARYPAPQLQPVSGLVPILLGAHHQYNLSDPVVRVECSRASQQKSDCYLPLLVQTSSNAHEKLDLHWTVPAGGLWHIQFVHSVTAFTAVCGLCALLRTVLSQHQSPMG